MAKPESVAFDLIEPITVNNETVTRLTVKKPKLRHLKSLPSAVQPGDILDLAVKLTGHLPNALDELGPEDTVKLMEVVSSFLESTPAIGSRSSG